LRLRLRLTVRFALDLDLRLRLRLTVRFALLPRLRLRRLPPVNCLTNDSNPLLIFINNT